MTSGNASKDLVSRYGPWALVLGASEGIGAQFARRLATANLNVVLVARNKERLDSLAGELEAQHGVETRVAAIDLSDHGAAERVVASAAGLSVGLVIFNAGAVDHGTPFLDAPVETWLAIVRRNDLVAVQLSHHYGLQMRDRGRGGLILVSSGAGAAGGSRIGIYSASKAFDKNFAEALWAELSGHGVDVLAAVVPPTRTPAMERLLVRSGLPQPETLADPDDVAAGCLEHLSAGPTLVFSDEHGGIDKEATEARRQLVAAISRATNTFFGAPAQEISRTTAQT
jgi:short-subunit dehydrogenase